MKDLILNFIDTFDFDELMELLSKIDLVALSTNPGFIVPAVILIVLLGHPRTQNETLLILQYILVTLYLVIALVVLKNSDLSEVGPFMMFMGVFLIGVATFIKNYLLK
jgi:hypothetical protein